ncbi:IS66 family insertion sequence element accessory protein TnpA [Iodobacter sp. BJB302]|uniref:IS66 family insertion sequence element accessory protein TnpA n=2 Tax=unclassified Iodobacter TaxID=235634 RepID=UPI000C0CDC84|nr:hypothetical protein [Iodobacter sp. BJB302]PHV03625.1 hypothetical protein CSQ88_00005 [Iodobacter sp. BJB302]
MGDLQTRRGEWLLRVAQWRESGLSQSAFCRLHHLKLATLSYWIARSNKSTSTAQEQPLTLVAAQWPKSPVMVLTHSHCRLELPANIAPEWLAQLIRGLA